MTGPARVTGALYIDMGQQLRNGTWARPPRAKYECVNCGYTSETVTGAAAVVAFIGHIRATHKATCTAAATEGAHAA